MRKSIYAAIDNISQIAQQGGNRCFAAAVQSLVDFFSVYQGHTTFRGLCRILVTQRNMRHVLHHMLGHVLHHTL